MESSRLSIHLCFFNKNDTIFLRISIISKRDQGRERNQQQQRTKEAAAKKNLLADLMSHAHAHWYSSVHTRMLLSLPEKAIYLNLDQNYIKKI